MQGQPMLLFRLEGPLQSWGERGQWIQRDSAYLPTKSGVIGLLACAMGIPRDDARIPAMHKALQMAVRVDKPGTMFIDFHTVTGILHTADGGQRGNREEESTLLSYRQYLQDASFLVAFIGEKEQLLKGLHALNNPVWPICLGRKCCIPSVPVQGKYTDRYATLDAAFKEEPAARGASRHLLIEKECDYGTILRPDAVIAGGSRSFAYRKTLTDYVEVH